MRVRSAVLGVALLTSAACGSGDGGDASAPIDPPASANASESSAEAASAGNSVGATCDTYVDGALDFREGFEGGSELSVLFALVTAPADLARLFDAMASTAPEEIVFDLEVLAERLLDASTNVDIKKGLALWAGSSSSFTAVDRWLLDNCGPQLEALAASVATTVAPTTEAPTAGPSRHLIPGPEGGLCRQSGRVSGGSLVGDFIVYGCGNNTYGAWDLIEQSIAWERTLDGEIDDLAFLDTFVVARQRIETPPSGLDPGGKTVQHLGIDAATGDELWTRPDAFTFPSPRLDLVVLEFSNELVGMGRGSEQVWSIPLPSRTGAVTLFGQGSYLKFTVGESWTAAEIYEVAGGTLIEAYDDLDGNFRTAPSSPAVTFDGRNFEDILDGSPVPVGATPFADGYVSRSDGTLRFVEQDGSVRWEIGGVTSAVGTRVTPHKIIFINLVEEVIDVDPVTGTERGRFEGSPIDFNDRWLILRSDSGEIALPQP